MSQPLKVSVLFGTGKENPELPEALKEIAGLKFLKQALTPEAFVAQLDGASPDLVLVDLDGMSRVPAWMDRVVSHLPGSRLVVCSQSRDPDFLIGLMKLKVDAFLSLPLNQQELSEVVGKLRLSLEQERLKEPAGSQVVAVTGSKGGVGVTSLATNLAVALAEINPTQVVLVDLARPFPHAGQFLDLKGSHTIRDLLQSVDSLDQVFIQKTVQRHKSALDVLLSTPDDPLSDSCLADTQALKKVIASLRAAYNWILVDLGSWIDVLYATLVREADRVLLVTELSVPDLNNLKRLRGMYYAWNVDDKKVNLVVNRYEKDFTLGLKDLENIFSQPVFATLPSDYASLIDAINQGLSLGEVAPRSRLWRSVRGMAKNLIVQQQQQQDQLSSGAKGFIRRLFR